MLRESINVVNGPTELPKDQDTAIENNRQQTNSPFTEIKHEVNNVYEHIVKWKRNMFTLPKRHAGKLFVKEISNLINAWCQKTEWREVSLKSLMILPSLLLQKASPKYKSSENKEMLERRLKLWQNGQINDLLGESSAIQSRLAAGRSTSSSEETTKKFTNFIINGNKNGALRLLENNERDCGILPINYSTINLLHEKHREAAEFFDDMLLNGPRKYIDPIMYETINADIIRQLSIETKGVAGPSKFDSYDWKRDLDTKLYGSEGRDLANSIANMAKQLCREMLTDPESIDALMVCQLIPYRQTTNRNRRRFQTYNWQGCVEDRFNYVLVKKEVARQQFTRWLKFFMMMKHTRLYKLMQKMHLTPSKERYC